jgi:type I restriction enzyme S subunit
LAALDDKIALNRRMNETLEALAQNLFTSWFVDATRLATPKDWREGKISDICTTQYGFTARATEEAVGPKFLRVMDINKRNWIVWSAVPHCSISEDEKFRYSLSVGDIVVARMADPGKSAIVEQAIDAVFASYLVRLKTDSLAHAYYLYHFLKSQAYIEYSQGAMSGSVQANMNAKVIVNAAMPIPPVSLINAFLEKVLPLRERIVSNVEESHTLAAVRDTLLPKLLSGELRVTVGGETTESST